MTNKNLPAAIEKKIKEFIDSLPMPSETSFVNTRDAHRSQYDDMAWAKAQRRGKPAYAIGDVVEFHAGGFGVIDNVSEPHGGWPASYATSDVKGLKKQPKSAWHYEGDFKWRIGKSPVHRLSKGKTS